MELHDKSRTACRQDGILPPALELADSTRNRLVAHIQALKKDRIGCHTSYWLALYGYFLFGFGFFGHDYLQQDTRCFNCMAQETESSIAICVCCASENVEGVMRCYTTCTCFTSFLVLPKHVVCMESFREKSFIVRRWLILIGWSLVLTDVVQTSRVE
jgi:hypothetical protein